MPTELGTLARPDAVLCRTNVGAMAHVMSLLAAGHRVALAGGGDSLRALALAARDLKEGRRTTHPELVLFPSWGELQDYAAHDPAGRDLQPLVDLVDTHGTDAILDRRRPPRAGATAPRSTVSTAHKAKGREWPCVKIADDFTPPEGHRPARRHRPAPYPDPSTTAKPASPTSPSPAPASASTSAACPGSTSTPAETRRHAESSSATRGGWAAAVTASRKRARDVPAPLSRPRRRGRAAHGLADAHGVGRGRWR